jgi:hypothetical protein
MRINLTHTLDLNYTLLSQLCNRYPSDMLEHVLTLLADLVIIGHPYQGRQYGAVQIYRSSGLFVVSIEE